MPKLILCAIVLLIVANASVAQPGGNLAVYADPLALSCDLMDIPGICEYTVVHMLTPGVTASQFKIETNHLGILVGWTSPFGVVLGDPLSGIAIGYGVCLSGQIQVLTMIYFCQGITPPCGGMSVVGHPTANPPGLLAADCSNNVVPVQGYTSYINNDGRCPCTSPIPVQETTWGQVKALYQ